MENTIKFINVHGLKLLALYKEMEDLQHEGPCNFYKCGEHCSKMQLVSEIIDQQMSLSIGLHRFPSIEMLISELTRQISNKNDQIWNLKKQLSEKQAHTVACIAVQD